MLRTRISAALAAVALVGVSVFAGSLVAYAAPPAPTMNLTGGWTSDPTPPAISGQVSDVTLAQTITVRVTVDGVTSDYCNATVPAGDPTASWQCTSAGPALSIGDHTFQSFAALDSDLADLSVGSDTTTYYVGGSQPATITSPQYYPTKDATPTFSGTGPSRGTVTVVSVLAPEGADVARCTAAVALDGTWSCTSTPFPTENTGPLDPALFSVRADAVQLGGGTSTSAYQALQVSYPDAPQSNYPYGDPWVTTQLRPALSGTMSVDAGHVTVWIEIAGPALIPYCEIDVAPGATNWACTSPLVDLAPGANTLSTSVQNEFGTQSMLGNSLTVTRVDAPTITTPTEGSYTNDATPTISGTAPYGAAITVYLDGEFSACPSPTITAGAWTCTSTGLEEGEHNLTVDVVGGSGGDPIQSKTTYFTVDTIDPNDPVVTTSGSQGQLPVIQGTAETGATVAVYVDGAPVACAAPAIADGSGAWFCELTVPLAVGPHTVTASQTDRAGNSSGAPAGASTISVLSPPTPNTPVITTAPSTVYSTTTPVSGTVTNPTSSSLVIRVTVTNGPNTYSCETTTSTGTWGCLVTLGIGANSVTALAYLDDGVLDNPSGTSNTLTVTRATLSAPSVGYTLGPASVAISGSVTDAAGDVYTGFYAVTVGGGEGGGYQYDQVSSCGTGGGDEGAASGIVGAAGTFACTFTALAPGIYNSYSHQQVGETSSPYANDYLIIPATPTLSTTQNGDGTTTYSGAGTAGYLAFVQTAAGAGVCTAPVNGLGTWQCTAPTAGGSFRAGQRAQGWVADTGSDLDVPDLSIQGYSAYTALVSVVVAAAPAPQPDPAPTPTPTPTATALPVAGPVAWTFTFGIGGTQFEPGDSTTITGSGLPAGAAVEAEFHSTPVALGDTTVAPSGSFHLPVTIPTDATAGIHHFVVTVTPLVGPPSTTEQAVTIKLGVKVAASPTRDEIAAILADESTAGTVDRSDPSAPSGMTDSIKGIAWVIDNPAIIGGAAVAGLALLLLVAFPAELLNSTVSEQYPRFAKRLPRLTLPWWQRFTAWLTTTPVFGGILITLLASIIFGFADPGFGFDITSVRVVLACFIALFIVGSFASSVSGAIIRRRWGLATVIELKPLGLVLTVVGVVLSRLLEFSPGFLLGLILGIGLVGRTTVAQRAKATLVQAGVVFVLAIIGWAIFSIVSMTQPDSFMTALLSDTMVAVTAEGLTALFIGLLPFRFLDGESIFQHSKAIWAVAYVLAAAAFVLIVVPGSWGDVGGSLWLWVGIVGAFALVAVGLYLYFRFWAAPLDEDEEEEPAKHSVEA